MRHIRLDHPRAARRVGRIIYFGVDSLKRFPFMGRKDRIPDTRELVFAPLPYIAVYRVRQMLLRFLASITRHSSTRDPGYPNARQSV